MVSGLVDFHCHLDLYPDFPALVRRCDEAGVFTLTVTTTPKAWSRNHALAGETRHVRAALGLHPQLVANRAHEVELWEELLPQTRYVGEVGLDAGPRYYPSFDAQKQVFEHVLKRCAASGDKVLTIHSVRSAKTVLDMIERHMPPARGSAVLHWFTGSVAEARRAVDLGCYFSVNAAMLDAEKQRALVATLPVERLLTETDGPFTKLDLRPTTPLDVGAAVRGLAGLNAVSETTMAQQVRANLKALLERKA